MVTRTFRLYLPKLFFILISTLFNLASANFALADCASAAAAVTTACETTPQQTVATQSSMNQAGSRDNMYEAATEMAAQLDAAAATNTSTANSCRAAGASCVSTCQAEAAAHRAQIRSCSEDSENSSASCEAQNQAHENAAKACEAKAAACQSSSAKAAATFDSQAATMKQQAAQARKSAAAAKANQKPVTPSKAPPQSLVSESTGDGKVLPLGAQKDLGDRQCLNEPEAYRHSSCTSRYIKQCKDKMADGRCQKFAKHYCTSSAEEVKREADNKAKREKKLKEIEERKQKAKEAGLPFVESDTDIDENKYFRDSGLGMGSGFCQYATALQFCNSGASGKSQCPSCLYGTNLRACDGDVAPCLATLPNGVREEAARSCPSDPLFLNPKFNPQNPTNGSPVAPPGLKGDGTKPAI